MRRQSTHTPIPQLPNSVPAPNLCPCLQPPPKAESELWDAICGLGPEDPLPADMPAALYMSLGGVLRYTHQYIIYPYFSCALIGCPRSALNGAGLCVTLVLGESTWWFQCIAVDHRCRLCCPRCVPR